MNWTEQAACSEIPTEMFFIDKGVSAQTREVKMILKVCESCPVSQICLETALQLEGNCGQSNRHGIWGGLLPAQRYKLAKSSTKPKENLCKKRLHEMTPENSFLDSGYVGCRACKKTSRAKYKSRVRSR